MAYVVVEDFKGGVDVRRSPVDAVPGTLRSAVNVHLTRGGEIETRRGLQFFDTLKAGQTKGLVSTGAKLQTFQAVGGPRSAPVLWMW